MVVSRVAFDADAEHIFDSQFQSVESGSGEGLSVIKIVLDPALLDPFESDFAAAFDGVDQPNVLSEDVGSVHSDGFLAKIIKKWKSVSGFETVDIVFLQPNRNNDAIREGNKRKTRTEIPVLDVFTTE